MNFRIQSDLFKAHAGESLERAKQTLKSQRLLFFKPYLFYGVHYALIPGSYSLVGRCIQQAVSISLGVCLITRSMFTSTSPTSELQHLAWATWQLAHALIVNACNVLIAMLSLISRSAATALNGGYLYEPEEVTFDDEERVGQLQPQLNEEQNTHREFEIVNMRNVLPAV